MKKKQAALLCLILPYVVVAQQQKLNSIAEYRFNDISGKWDQKYTQNLFEYTEDNKQKSHEYHSWNNEEQKWNPLTRNEYSYENGQLKTYLRYITYQNIAWNLRFAIKDEYVYTNDRLQMISGFAWSYSGSKWLISTKEEYDYYDNGDLKAIILFDNKGTNEAQDWLPAKKYSYLYQNDRLFEMTYYEYDADKEVWLETLITEYEYSSTGNYRKKFLYHYVVDAWTIKQEESFYLDEEYDPKRYYNRGYNDATSEWYKYKHEFNYDESFTMADLVLPEQWLDDDEKVFFQHRLLRRFKKEFDSGVDEYLQYSLIQYNYSDADTPNNVEKVTEKNISIYPNPANTQVIIKGCDGPCTFELYSTSGAQILGMALNSSNVVELNGINEGVYIYRVIEGEKVSSGKLIIQP